MSYIDDDLRDPDPPTESEKRPNPKKNPPPPAMSWLPAWEKFRAKVLEKYPQLRGALSGHKGDSANQDCPRVWFQMTLQDPYRVLKTTKYPEKKLNDDTIADAAKQMLELYESDARQQAARPSRRGLPPLQ